MKIQALILAAGRGSRLGSLSETTPKPLLEVARVPLVEHQLATLSEAGVGPIGMVLGFAADEIRSTVGQQVEYLHNPRWASTNSLYSFTRAREWVTGDSVILNCDILFDPEILDRLLATGGDCLAYDSASGDGREHMKVGLQDGRVVAMSKDIDLAHSHGENVGLLYLRKETVDALFAAAEELLAEGQEGAWIGAAVLRVAQDHPIRGVDVAGLPWGEIDFPYDLERARREVWPAIEKRRRDRRPAVRLRRMFTTVVALAALIVAGAFLLATVMTPAAKEWEALSISGLAQARIQVRDVPQDWYLLQAGQQVLETTVEGPTEVRIETRLVLPTTSDLLHYVIATSLGEEPEEWHAETARRSGSATHPQWTIAKRERETLAIPEGRHRLRVRLEMPDDGLCLARIRQSVQGPDD